MRLLSILVLFGATGCATSHIKIPDPVLHGRRLDSQDRGVPLLSIRLVHASERPPEKEAYGQFYFVDSSLRFSTRTVVVGYDVTDGMLTDVFAYWQSEQFLAELRSVGFEAFDLDAEIQEVDERRKKETEARGEHPSVFQTFDGAEFEISISFDGVSFKATRRNIQSWIDEYAPYSSKIGKLKKVLDVFALHLGHDRLPG
jgi:hypothetical protein